MPSEQKRFVEIDFARGFAVVMMVLFNWQFALSYFGLLEFNSLSGFWWFFARATASAFIFIAGVSLWLSFEKAKAFDEPALRKKYFSRGLKLFALGMLVTLATALFLRDGFIVFGILHLLGFSTVLAFPLLRFTQKNLFALGVVALAAGFFLSGVSFDFPWLLWLGFVPKSFYSLDYFPLLPWFGVFLFGMAFGKKFYFKAKPSVAVKENRFSNAVCLFGRRSLAVYLLHQPVLIALLYLLGFSAL